MVILGLVLDISMVDLFFSFFFFLSRSSSSVYTDVLKCDIDIFLVIGGGGLVLVLKYFHALLCS